MPVLSRFTRSVLGLGHRAKSSLRRLAAQLSSLATLEAAVAHDVQTLLEAPPEPVVPIPATRLVSRTSSPLALPLSLAQGRSQSGLSVKSRSVSSCRHSCSSASANGPVESRSTSGVARSPTPSRVPQPLFTPRPLLGRQVRGVVPQAPLKHGIAGGTSATKRSMWREISLKHPRPVQCVLAVPTPRPMMTSTTRATPCCSCSRSTCGPL